MSTAWLQLLSAQGVGIPGMNFSFAGPGWEEGGQRPAKGTCGDESCPLSAPLLHMEK